MAMTICKECKAQISTKAEACPQCGAKLPKTSGCAVLIAAIFGLILLSAITRGCSGNDSPPVPKPSNSAPAQAATPATPPPPPDPAKEMADATRTVKDVETRLKNTAERLKKYYGTTEQLKEATADMLKLAIIKAKYEDSKEREELALGKRAGSVIDKVARQQRVIYASTAEEIFIKNGMDIDVTARGSNNEQLRFKYILMSQPLVYKFQNEMKIQEQARMFGFKKIVYTDGYDDTWTVDL